MTEQLKALPMRWTAADLGADSGDVYLVLKGAVVINGTLETVGPGGETFITVVQPRRVGIAGVGPDCWYDVTSVGRDAAIEAVTRRLSGERGQAEVQ